MRQNYRGTNITVANYCLKLILIILLTALIISVLILSSVPPVSKDALTHHLAVPKLYIKNAGIYEIPHLIVSYYPMNLDLLYAIPLYFNNDIIPKYIHFTFALFTALLIFYYLRKRIDGLYGIFGMLFFLSLPVIVKLSITAYVDIGLIFFSTASIICLFSWIENDFQLRYLLLSAICCGLALGTKYNGVIVLFLLTLFVPFVYLRKTHIDISRKTSSTRQVKAIGYGTFFMLVSLIVFSPWMIKNYVWTQNPLYPLYDHLFNPDKIAQFADSNAISTTQTDVIKSKGHLNHFSLRKILYGETWWQIALIPVRIFFEGKDGTPQYFDGKLNPLLLFLPFFAFVGLRRNRSILQTEKKIMLGFASLYILFVFFEKDMRIRWITPAIPPLVLLSTFGLHNIYSLFLARFSPVTGKICSAVVSSLLFLMLWSNVAYIGEQFKHVDPLSYLFGRIGRDEYIEKFRHEYPTIQFANNNLSEDAKILCFFLGNRLYYSDRNMVFNEELFRKTVKQARLAKTVFLGLEREGITHLLIRHDLFNSWLIDNFDEREKMMIKKFFDEHANLLFSKNVYGLFELKKRVAFRQAG
jgi:4-amino-4-deoxy-L-arabinose transferase-like glycosyltransferase